MPNPCNKITVRFEIVNEEASQALWESAKTKGPLLAGMRPGALSWGDMFAELRAMESRYEIAKKLLEREGCWESIDKLDRLERLFSIDKIRGF